MAFVGGVGAVNIDLLYTGADHIPVPGITLPEGFIMSSVNYMVKGVCPHCACKTHHA